MLWKGILLKELSFDNIGDFKSELLIFWQWILSDQLHNFIELNFLMKNLFYLLPQVWELLIVVLVEIFVQLPLIVRCWNCPVYWGEMLFLSQLLVQPPENLYDWKGWSCDWVSKVTTWRTNCTDDSNGAVSVWWAQACNLSSSFIELCKFGCQISRISWITRHFSQSTWDFSQGFCPTRGGVSHHWYVSTHISEIFSKSNTCIDTGLTGSHRHVGSICHKWCPLHDWYFLSVLYCCEGGEFFQDFSHLISSFTTSDINNNLAVRVLWKGLRNAGFTATKGSRNGTGSTKDRWEHSIQYSLSSNQGNITSKFFNNWSRLPDRPFMTHWIFGSLSINLQF